MILDHKSSAYPREGSLYEPNKGRLEPVEVVDVSARNSCSLFTPFSSAKTRNENGEYEPPKGGDGQATAPSSCFSFCSPCDMLLLINGLLLVVSFVAGRVIGKESAAHHFSTEKSHKRRTVMMAGLLLCVVILLALFGALSTGFLILAAVTFTAGFIFARSSANFNKKETSFNLEYNKF